MGCIALASFTHTHVHAPRLATAGLPETRYFETEPKGGEYVLSNRRFCMALREKGFESSRSGGVWFRGLKVTEVP